MLCFYYYPSLIIGRAVIYYASDTRSALGADCHAGILTQEEPK